MQHHRRQGPRIDQVHSRSVGELEYGPRMFRERLIDAPDLPVSCHPEMDVNRAPIIESEQLMLSPAVDAGNRGAADSSKSLRRQSAAQRWMQQGDSRQAFADHGTTKDPRGLFDFG